ncbi:hypothetical protein [Candidatus Berkiella aquae]|uniref:Uncharacterized protein n=1 Tax=Candidatus Berkiella aquae TaxID=295108 RepID=A0A0Q9Z1A0_9GAMM|nr:hypothetical protein [Candidatus Berkiella aquae]MCS5711785.1 hypothetical protein [Candidatus Berkiella aquae]
MSLHQGPTHFEKLTVESCLETLSKLLLQCEEESVYHQEKINQFFKQQTFFEPGSGNKIKLLDIRHLTDRYPENEVVTTLAQKAHLYMLTVQGNLTILKEGCRLLSAALIKNSEKLHNQSFITLDLTALKALAEIKLNLEHSLEDYLRKHPQIIKGSTEDLLKNTFNDPLAKLTANIAMLTPCERFAIEYFGTIFDSQTTFKLLTEYQSSLVVLTDILATLTPIAIKPVANEDWDSVFPTEGFPVDLDLSARLEKLRVSGGTPNSSDDDDEKRWAEVDAFKLSSLTSSSSSEASPSSARPVVSEPILTQYLQTSAPQPTPTVVIEAPAQPTPTSVIEEEKKTSTLELAGL